MLITDRGYRGVEYEVAARMKAQGGDCLIRFLKASQQNNMGFTAYSRQSFGEAQANFENVLELLSGVPGTELIRAIAQSSLVSIYGRKEQFAESIAVGVAAIAALRNEPRLAMFCANCMHDTGLSMVNAGQLAEGLKHLEDALAIYETREDAAEVAVTCMKNIEMVRARLHEQRDTRSWWSRLWGR